MPQKTPKRKFAVDFTGTDPSTGKRTSQKALRALVAEKLPELNPKAIRITELDETRR